MPEISALVAGDVYDQTSRAVGENDVAAMPSLHTALTVTVALIMSRYGPVWRRAGIAYVCMMGVALVYLGEHYVIDELAGVALALGVWKLVFGRARSSGLSVRPNAAKWEGTGSGYSKAA